MFPPFGQEVNASGVARRFKFTGHERDSESGESGQDHTLYRQYASHMGRWLTPDPGGLAVVNPFNPQSWNRYSYANNNPLNAVDPLGLEMDCANSSTTADGQFTMKCNPRPPKPVDPGCEYFFNCFPYRWRGGDSTPFEPDDEGPEEVYPPLAQGVFQGNSRTCNSAATWGNAAGYGIAAVMTGVPAAAAVPGVAAKGVGWYAGLTGGGGVVLGKYPDYVNAARAIGANALNLGDRTWRMFDWLGESWTVNKAFLDASIARGQQFYTTTPLPQATGWLYMELQYLSNRGAAVLNGLPSPARH
ncbi:MAG: RHS repeat-associated core domain-containing protein [Candidatus Korobacteraceae bacterium]